MLQTAEVNTETLRWPIAPDGYIPNSVIRSWRRTGKEPPETHCCDSIFNYHQMDEDTTNGDDEEEEDVSSRIFWFIQDEEDEDEAKIDQMYDLIRRIKKIKNEKNKSENVEKIETERKRRLDEKKENEEDKTDRTYRKETSNSIHTDTYMQNNQKKYQERIVRVEPRNVSLTDKSKKTVNITPTSGHVNGHKPLKDLRDDTKLLETITHPLQHLSVPLSSSIIPEEFPEPPVESAVMSADEVISKQGYCRSTHEDTGPRAREFYRDRITLEEASQKLRITLYVPTVELQNLTPPPLKPPSSTPVDPQRLPKFGSPCWAVRDNTYNNIRDQEQVYLNHKVLELFKKSKVSGRNSHLRKLSVTAERPPTSTATHSTIQTQTGRMNLRHGPGGPSEFRAPLHPVRCPIINPKCPCHQFRSDHSAQFAQTMPQAQRLQSMPEWRKNFYELISLQGFCSSRAARLATAEHSVKSSNARNLAAAIPSLQPGMATSHQRVVQKIQMKDALEPVSCHFHHVIPMASQHSFFTLNPRGTTRYGRLQFDWMRGSEENTRLNESAVKIKDTAHEGVSENRAFNHLNRSD